MYILSLGGKLNNLLIWLLNLLSISLTKNVYNSFKKEETHFIQININMNIKISNECLFLEIVGPVTHQAVLLTKLIIKPGVV